MLKTSISKPTCIISFYSRRCKAKLALVKNEIQFGIYISRSLEIKSVLMNLISYLDLNKYMKIICLLELGIVLHTVIFFFSIIVSAF